jgi:hypothetical protein
MCDLHVLLSRILFNRICFNPFFIDYCLYAIIYPVASVLLFYSANHFPLGLSLSICSLWIDLSTPCSPRDCQVPEKLNIKVRANSLLTLEMEWSPVSLNKSLWCQLSQQVGERRKVYQCVYQGDKRSHSRQQVHLQRNSLD